MVYTSFVLDSVALLSQVGATLLGKCFKPPSLVIPEDNIRYILPENVFLASLRSSPSVTLDASQPLASQTALPTTSGDDFLDESKALTMTPFALLSAMDELLNSLQTCQSPA